MVNPWRKYKRASKRKKQALHSLFAGLAFFSVLYFLTKTYEIILCPVRRFLGIPCLGCGLTSGFIAILHFNFREAVKCHILSIPIFCSTVIYAILCFSDILLGRNDLSRLSSLCGKKYMFILYGIILVFSAVANRIIRI